MKKDKSKIKPVPVVGPLIDDLPVKPSAVLVVKTESVICYANLEDSAGAKAFVEKLNPLVVDMHGDAFYEKVGILPFEWRFKDEPTHFKPGDIIIFENGTLAVCRFEGEGFCTRVARMGDTSYGRFKEAVGDGDVQITFYLEWSE